MYSQLDVPTVGRRRRLGGGIDVPAVGRQLRPVGGGDLNGGDGCIGLLRKVRNRGRAVEADGSRGWVSTDKKEGHGTFRGPEERAKRQ